MSRLLTFCTALLCSLSSIAAEVRPSAPQAKLEQGTEEPQWAANLCHQALAIDSHNGHAFYQLACAYTDMRQYDEAVRYLSEALNCSEAYREDIMAKPALRILHDYAPFRQLLKADRNCIGGYADAGEDATYLKGGIGEATT